MREAFDAQLSNLERRKEFVKALRAMGLQGGGTGSITVGDRVVPDYGSAITKIAGAFLGQQEEGALKADEAAYQADYGSALEKALDRYDKTQAGTPAMFTEAVDRDDNLVPSPEIKGDPRKAAIAALVSRFPEMRALGAMDYSNLSKRELDEFGQPVAGVDAEGNPTFQRFGKRTPGGVTVPGFQPKPEYLSADGRILNTTGPTPKVALDIRERSGPIVPATPTVPAYQLDQDTGRARSLGGLPPAAIPPAAKVEGALDLAGAKKVEAGYDTAQNHVRAIQSNTDALNKLAQIPDIHFGTAAEFRNEIGKLGGLVGWDIPEGVTNMQELRGILGRQILDKARALAPVTEVDISYLEKTLGSTSNTKAALKGMLERLNEIEMRGVENYNKQVDRFVANPDQRAKWKVDFSTTTPAQRVPPPEAPTGVGPTGRPRKPLSEIK